MKSIVVCIGLFILAVNSYSVTVSENFADETYKDPAGTNADWNTASGVLELPRYTAKLFAATGSTATIAATRSEGWRFSVKEPGEIISLGRYFNSTGSGNTTVNLWSDTGVCLATATVAYVSGWSWAAISPVEVSTGAFYRVSVVCISSASLVTETGPFENAYVKLSSACYSSSPTGFPGTLGGALAGLADFEFRTLYKTHAYGQSKGYYTGTASAKYLSYSATQTLNGCTVNYFFSSSPDGSSWSEWQSSIVNVGSGGYVRWRAELITADPRKSPEITGITIYDNSFPGEPLLLSPSDDFYINRTSCTFSWAQAYDPDSPPPAYDLQAGYSTNFSSPVIEYTSIDTNTVTVTGLGLGIWHWRVSAVDDYGSRGPWSGDFTLNADTVPPTRIDTLEPSAANINGAVKLIWVSPADPVFRRIDSYSVYFATFHFTQPSEANRVPGPYPPQSPGNYETLTVSGLAGRSTWYFAVNAKDFAGNVSRISQVKSFMINVPAAVRVIYPAGGETLSAGVLIEWSVNDPNTEDTFHNVGIYVSKNAGATYSLLKEIDYTNIDSWQWDTTFSGNGSSFRIKVVATDYRGLSGAGVSADNFSVNNQDSRPEITITKPAPDDIERGSSRIEWYYSDPDRYDIVYFNIYLSSDSGGTWYGAPIAKDLYLESQLHEGTTGYSFNTAHYPDGGKYRLKVEATDGILSSATVSGDFNLWNNDHYPEAFALTSPSYGAVVTTLMPEFLWQGNSDPDSGYGDEVGYKFYLYSSTATSDMIFEMPSISTNSYTLSSSLILSDGATYYWTAEAIDSTGLATASSSGLYSFYVKWAEVSSRDGELSVRSLDMPHGSFLSVEEVSGYAPAEEADALAEASPIMKLPGGKVYHVELKNALTGQTEDASGKHFELTFSYGGLDIISPSTIKIFRLDAGNSWAYLAGQTADEEKKEVSVTVAGLSYFRLASYAAPASAVGEVGNYPNPFDPVREETEIEYVLTSDSNVNFEIFTQAGDLVRKFSVPAGSPGGKGSSTGETNIVKWDGKNGSGRVAANGIYILRVTVKPASGGEYVRKRLIGVVK